MDIRCTEMQQELWERIKKRKSDRLMHLTLRKSEAWRGVAVGILRLVLRSKLLNGSGASGTKETLMGRATMEALRRVGQSEERAKERGSVEETRMLSSQDAEIARLDQRLEKLRNETHEAKEAEISRISREFIVRGYEQRYGVSQNQVMAALIGEDRANFFTGRQLKERGEYVRDQQKLTTFCFGPRKMSGSTSKR